MNKQTFLTFLLGRECFAVNVVKVLEVLEKQYITQVPQAPAHILGIINFRGDILPVVDTRQKFNLPSLSIEDKTFIIVYDVSDEANKIIIAATADAVKDVIEISDDEIKPVPEMGISYNVKYISGAVRRNEEFILLLDIEKVFSLSDKETIEALPVTETNEPTIA
ncbi:MAG TPA: chemotaxis protein CheW [Bacteroidales bacterium]